MNIPKLVVIFMSLMPSGFPVTTMVVDFGISGLLTIKNRVYFVLALDSSTGLVLRAHISAHPTDAGSIMSYSTKHCEPTGSSTLHTIALY